MEDKNSELISLSRNYFPGGINGLQTSFWKVGGTPVFSSSSKGAYFTDINGKTYLDFFQNAGATILGHSHPQVISAITEQALSGFSAGTPTELEIELAKLIRENIPNPGLLRFFSSKTEVLETAISLSKDYTKKELIIAIKGCSGFYSDFSFDFNDIDKIEDFFKTHPTQIAAIILSPIAENFGCILPENQYLKRLRTLCNEFNTALIFDESSTGFRLGLGGAQDTFEVYADLVIYGKILGGGLPLTALSGSNEYMERLFPLGRVQQRGDYISNPLAMAAGIKTLKIIKEDPQFYSRINKTAELLDFEIAKILNKKNIRHRINRIGSMMSLYFHVSHVSNTAEAENSNLPLYNNFFHQVLERGIFLPADSLGIWSVSDAFGKKEIIKTLDAVQAFQYS